jgi:hypothetical protein
MKTDQNLEGQSKLQDPGIFHAVIQFWHHSSELRFSLLSISQTADI